LILARSILFAVLFYLWSGVLCLLCLPVLLMPRRVLTGAFRFWSRGVIALLGVAGVRVEVRGREHMPAGKALIAAKHLCMFDVFAQFAWLPDSCFVMRKELMIIPFFGWYAKKARMIVVDREGGAKALRDLVRDGQDRLAQAPRQLVIFPEGTRGEPGVAGTYQPGVAGLYRDLEMPVVLLATNSGVHWPAHGFLRRPGTIVFEYLEPLPAGLKRAEFMREMQARIEAASNALLPL
jgi:1-acyl-sn-glycerol-3-phosphate acyltransferase